MEYFNCISFAAAMGKISDNLAGIDLPVEEVDLTAALGRVCAGTLVADSDLPPFSRSVVDGYAVLSRDTFGASEGVPALLTVTGEILMGQSAKVVLYSGAAAVIPTGGMLPPGADSVVMIEQAERPAADTLLVLKAVAPGENVIAQGEDLKKGAVVATPGQRLTSADIGALAACGISRVPVRQRPRIGILSTGDEIVDVNVIPQAGQIRDINSYALAALLEQEGCRAKRYGIIADEYDQLRGAVQDAVRDNDLVIISGGSSVGARDHTVKVIEELGRRAVIFHGLLVKPGKPTIFGMVGSTPVFGLPGHPVAALTICQKLILPAMKELQGVPDFNGGVRLPARLGRNMASAAGRDDFLRVRLRQDAGEYWADPILGKSGLISTLTGADGLVHILSDQTGLYAGDRVLVELIRK